MEEVSTKNIQHFLFTDDGTFPNNANLPVVIYRSALELPEKKNKAARQVKKLFKQNDWKNSWRDAIHDYHHYHSITHEVLAVYRGKVTVQLGGPEGQEVRLKTGDVIVIPAGVAHKCVRSTEDFMCLGAYPGGSDYDMNYGYEKERAYTEENIQKVQLPKLDPIAGEDGPLFRHWK